MDGREVDTAGQVREVLAAAVGPGRAEELAGAYAQASGGNRVLVQALADDAADVLGRGAEPGEIPVGSGERFTRAVRTVVADLSPTEAWVAAAVGMLGAQAGGASAIADLTEMDVDAAAAALDRLRAQGLVGASGFRHPAVRSVVLARVEPAARARLHLRAARAQHEAGVPAPQVAAHLVAAGDAPGEWAREALHRAAAQAADRDRLDFAVSALELAARVDPDPAATARTVLALSRLQWRTEPGAAGRHLLALVPAAQSGVLDRAARTAVAHGLLVLGHLDEADAVLATVPGVGTGTTTGGLDAADGPPTAAEIARLAELRQWFPGRVPAAALPDTTSGSQGAGTAESVVLLLDAVSGTRTGHEPIERSTARARRRLARGRDARLDEPGVVRAVHDVRTLITAEQHDAADAWSLSFLRRAHERGAITWAAQFASVCGEAALARGDLTAALRFSQFALRQLSRRCWGVSIGLPYAVAATALTGMGRHDDAAVVLRHRVPDAMFATRYGLRYLQARADLQLALGRPDDAGDTYTRVGQLATAWDCDDPAQEPWQLGRATALLARGEVAGAHDLVLEQLGEPAAATPRLRGALLRVRGATEPLRARRSTLREAVTLLETAGDGFGRARVLAELAGVYTALGASHQARSTVRQATDLGRFCGASTTIEHMLATEPTVLDEPVTAPVAPTGTASAEYSGRPHLRLAATG